MIRPARDSDIPTLIELIRELADYERALDQVRVDEMALRRALFCDHPAVFCHVAVDDAGAVVGLALWFRSFSTWLGVHGLYLEDLYVRPTARDNGYGKALLARLAGVAVENGYGRVEWAVLDWNEPAMGFYRSLGAEPMQEWTTWRLTGEALERLGELSPDQTLL